MNPFCLGIFVLVLWCILPFSVSFSSVFFFLAICRSDMSKDQIVNELAVKGKILLGCGILLVITSLGVLGYSAFK